MFKVFIIFYSLLSTPIYAALIEADFRTTKTRHQQETESWSANYQDLKNWLGNLVGLDRSSKAQLESILDAKGTPKPNSQDEFFFGLATAPAHVEDQLEDSWLDFANSGGVKAYFNTDQPEERLRFWSEPEVELDLAHETGIEVFRLGVDWSRLVPYPLTIDPKKNFISQVDQAVLDRYKQIISMIKERNMKVMLTLFHHSLPKWAVDLGGWEEESVKLQFLEFSKQVIKELYHEVDYWITFNEPSIFCLLTHTVGIWPANHRPSFASIIDVPHIYSGSFVKAQNNMIESHNILYDYIHKISASNQIEAKVSIAKHISKHIGSCLSPIKIPLAQKLSNYINFGFLDHTINHMDYISVNYYGGEHFCNQGLQIRDDREYSESGRAVHPYGLYEILKTLHQRYNKNRVFRKADPTASDLPIIITENGISDATDYIRPSYLIEHLMAVNAARNEGVPVNGYIFWTISDNWEWADGYCPKFGLVAVDRSNNLKRKKRRSYHLFKAIVKRKYITKQQRMKAWNWLQAHINTPRSFCRDSDGQTPLNDSVDRPLSKTDWRFSQKPLDKFIVSETVDSSFTDKLAQHADLIKNHPIFKGVISFSEIFSTVFEHANVFLDHESNRDIVLQIKLKPEQKVVCSWKEWSLVDIHLVFNDDLYFIKEFNLEKSIDIRGVKIFVGPTGDFNWGSNLLFRTNLQKITLDKDSIRVQTSHNMIQPKLPLKNKNTKIRCKSVDQRFFKD